MKIDTYVYTANYIWPSNDAYVRGTDSHAVKIPYVTLITL